MDFFAGRCSPFFGSHRCPTSAKSSHLTLNGNLSNSEPCLAPIPTPLMNKQNKAKFSTETNLVYSFSLELDNLVQDMIYNIEVVLDCVLVFRTFVTLRIG